MLKGWSVGLSFWGYLLNGFEIAIQQVLDVLTNILHLFFRLINKHMRNIPSVFNTFWMKFRSVTDFVRF